MKKLAMAILGIFLLTATITFAEEEKSQEIIPVKVQKSNPNRVSIGSRHMGKTAKYRNMVTKKEVKNRSANSKLLRKNSNITDILRHREYVKQREAERVEKLDQK